MLAALKTGGPSDPRALRECGEGVAVARRFAKKIRSRARSFCRSSHPQPTRAGFPDSSCRL